MLMHSRETVHPAHLRDHPAQHLYKDLPQIPLLENHRPSRNVNHHRLVRLQHGHPIGPVLHPVLRDSQLRDHPAIMPDRLPVLYPDHLGSLQDLQSVAHPVPQDNPLPDLPAQKSTVLPVLHPDQLTDQSMIISLEIRTDL